MKKLFWMALIIAGSLSLNACGSCCFSDNTDIYTSTEGCCGGSNWY